MRVQIIKPLFPTFRPFTLDSNLAFQTVTIAFVFAGRVAGAAAEFLLPRLRAINFRTSNEELPGNGRQSSCSELTLNLLRKLPLVNRPLILFISPFQLRLKPCASHAKRRLKLSKRELCYILMFLSCFAFGGAAKLLAQLCITSA